jgi:flagellar protein FlbD
MVIKLTKINGEEIAVNAELIETVRATPDTVINLTTEKKILVLEDVDEVIKRIIDYRRNIMGCKGVE